MMDLIEIIAENVDWTTLFSTIWTVILCPIAKQAYDYAKAKKIDKYAKILYDEVVKAVKATYEESVKNLKGTERWTVEMQTAVKAIAKQKAVNAISNTAYKMLNQANKDFDDWLDSMVETALYDLKNTSK